MWGLWKDKNWEGSSLVNLYSFDEIKHFLWFDFWIALHLLSDCHWNNQISSTMYPSWAEFGMFKIANKSNSLQLSVTFFLFVLTFMNLSVADGYEYSYYIPRLVSESNNATLLFTSDEVVNRRGVLMSYTIGKLIYLQNELSRVKVHHRFRLNSLF